MDDRLSRLRALEAKRAELAALKAKAERRQYPTPGSLERALDAKSWEYPHLGLIDDYLCRLEARTLGTRGLMIFMQPRAGKSRRASRVFPLWYLRRRPSEDVVVASYGLHLAAGHARWVRNTIATRPELGLVLADGSKRVDDWTLNAGGGMRAVGVGGGITGRGANLLVIDDPVKGREEAQSEVMREKTWDWWTDDLSTRLTVSGDDEPVVLLMMTRWHEDDLAGRLLASEPEHWTVLSLPALAEEADPLGRAPGEVLMPDRYGPAWIDEQRARLGSYGFTALYQQRPTPEGGGFFTRSSFRYWTRWDTDAGERWLLGDRHVEPGDCWRFATVDLAASEKTSADWSVCSVWAVTPDRDLLLIDRGRARMDETRHVQLVRPLVEKHRVSFVGIEKGFASSTLAYDMGRSGIAVVPLVPDRDKVTRAIPAQSLLEAGKVWWPADAAWLEEWERELLGFPQGTHDDQVDTFAYAAHQVVLGARGRPYKRVPASDSTSVLWRQARQKRKREASEQVGGVW